MRLREARGTIFWAFGSCLADSPESPCVGGERASPVTQFRSNCFMQRTFLDVESTSKFVFSIDAVSGSYFITGKSLPFLPKIVHLEIRTIFPIPKVKGLLGMTCSIYWSSFSQLGTQAPFQEGPTKISEFGRCCRGIHLTTS